ncbi:hypothetical protein [Gracilibacillus saliphilus]|uniref:hypothetical protein n=1 Tax=Gracilibacillus saliphilus TaxID=543890 RepID=UPI0013D501A4|nr:hypothetical protein [Gracilibacillus saliphilus]
MKTNIKNGAFIYDYIPVDTGQVKLGDAGTGEGVKYTTRADGLYPVIAETNDKGIVTNLVVDVSEVNFIFENDEVIEIDEDDILNHGVEPVEVFIKRMNDNGLEVAEPVNIEDATREELLELVYDLIEER